MTSEILHVSLFLFVKVYKFVPPVFSGIQICEPCVYFKKNCNVLMQVDKTPLIKK